MKTKDIITRVERITRKHPNYNGHNDIIVDIVNNQLSITVENCGVYTCAIPVDFTEWMKETTAALYDC